MSRVDTVRRVQPRFLGTGCPGLRKSALFLSPVLKWINVLLLVTENWKMDLKLELETGK